MRSSATIILGEAATHDAVPSLNIGPGESVADIDALYASGVLFHGPNLRPIISIDALNDVGLEARITNDASPEDWFRNPIRSGWIGAPLALDGVLQLLIVWGQRIHGKCSLPHAIASYRQFARSIPSGQLKVALSASNQGAILRADAELIDATGKLVARIEGIEHTMDASLAAAFERNQLPQAVQS